MATADETTLIYSDFGSDEDLAELVEMFVDEIPARVQSMLDAAESSDWEQLGRIAHQMKGAAGSYGFGEVTNVAARLEHACREGDSPEAIQRGLQDLVTICLRMRSGAPQ
ncbi:Hpt domain-containing protein [Blastopirellula marina]|nr:Hpt domain-containing protein [Blastopirellula marina]